VNGSLDGTSSREQTAETLGASDRAMYVYLAGTQRISQTAMLCRALDEMKARKKS
jgi:hypothetical protein